MSRIVYLNGDFVSEEDARISIFDRAVLFGDAIYEVTAVVGGALLNFVPHMRRLYRSANAIDLIGLPELSELERIHKTLIARNDLRDGMIYLQVSRGSNGDRDYLYRVDTKPTVFLFSQSKPGFVSKGDVHQGLRVQLLPDLRWARRDIKSTQLLYPVLAKQRAVSEGFDDAWFVQGGQITEGTTNNAGIILNGCVVTHPVDDDILAGTARASLLSAAVTLGMTIEERTFCIEEAKQAEEAFLTSSMNILVPVIQIDQREVGNGKVGPAVKALRAEMVRQMTAGGLTNAHHPVSSKYSEP